MSKPRVLFVSRTRYRLPLSPTLARKWDALAAELDLRVYATAVSGSAGDATFVLVSPRSGASFWLSLPFRVAGQLRTFRPEVVVTQSPYEAAATLLARTLVRSRARIVADVHGDWRTATRLYGSPLRAALRPVADAIAAAALRRVDSVRTVSAYTSRLVRELGIEPAGSFPAIIDLDAFTDRAPVEPPAAPLALFVGVLERYKNIDGLADAWRLVAERAPQAQLHVVGKGTLENVVAQLVRDLPGSTRWTRELDAHGVAAAMDEATLLVLPSRSEGMGRVALEAFCRARPVIGARVGGIPDLVEDGVNGLLVDAGSTEQLAGALERLLADRAYARELGETARRHVQPMLLTPEEFASRTLALVEELRA
ncbi:MAG TPA: glycosyltransferase family 4 protein [Gaiellaceae bacterium]|nr:glycosyltransferase family 4 protein [Gaiellaceae bacterium]